jgi:predicted ATPase
MREFESLRTRLEDAERQLQTERDTKLRQSSVFDESFRRTLGERDQRLTQLQVKFKLIIKLTANENYDPTDPLLPPWNE